MVWEVSKPLHQGFRTGPILPCGVLSKVEQYFQ